jgi:RHS repeat-associated protein
MDIMDDKGRIALVEPRNDVDNGSPREIIRYQLENHLGSASLEIDDKAEIISYEGYTSYGSTSYQAMGRKTKTPKRYRYTSKERDEESVLYYHGVRYYAPWLGRWISCDPLWLVDGPNLFRYSRNCPVVLDDWNGMDPPDSRKFGSDNVSL